MRAKGPLDSTGKGQDRDPGVSETNQVHPQGQTSLSGVMGTSSHGYDSHAQSQSSLSSIRLGSWGGPSYQGMIDAGSNGAIHTESLGNYLFVYKGACRRHGLHDFQFVSQIISDRGSFYNPITFVRLAVSMSPSCNTGIILLGGIVQSST